MWAGNAHHTSNSSELLQESCPVWIKLKILLMDNLDFRPEARFMLLLGQDISTFPPLIYVCTTVTWVKLEYPSRNLAWTVLCVDLICAWASQLLDIIFPFCEKGRECNWYAPQNMRTFINLYGMIASRWTLWHGNISLPYSHYYHCCFG